MSTLSIDFETRATVDLRETGVYPYAAHPDTDIWCMAWAFDDEPVQLWVPGQGLPPAIQDHILRGGELRAWNAQFERIIWREIMVPRYGAAPVPPEQWVCSMVEARAMGLPGSLDQAAKVLGVTQQKDSEGYGLMMRLTRPRSTGKDGRPIWWTNAEGKLDRLYEYCKQDVRTERAIIKALRRLTPNERELYLLDQRINDRGLGLDVALIESAMEVASEGTERANAALSELTGGAVRKVSNNGDLRAYLNEQGLGVDSVSKPVVAELLSSDLDPTVRQVLQLKADAGRTSVAKLKSMLAAVCADHRVRGLLQYYGASTGRWAGRLVQPHNFPRGTVENPEWYIPLVMQRRYDEIDMYAPPLGVISSLLRSMLVATEGRTYVGGDFSAIEARVLNWLAGQEDILEAFRAYDAGDKSMDPYKRMAVMMGLAPSTAEVTKQDRQAGKAAELGCGFQMAAKKYVTAAWDVYQVRLDLKGAHEAVKIYRKSHEKVVQLWWDLETACVEATLNPGVVHTVAGKLKVVVRGAYLYIILPSGRPLCYAAPAVRERTSVIEVAEEQPDGSVILIEKEMTKMGLEFSALDPITKQWTRERTYGGKLTENVVQAVARDLMAAAMLRCDGAGYPIVLTVHDEILSEPLAEMGSELSHFESLMSITPAWASGCPVAAEAWSGPRYKK